MGQSVEPCQHSELEFVVIGATVFVRCIKCTALARLHMDGNSASHFTTIGAHIALSVCNEQPSLEANLLS
jgi:hypothetical protein